MYREMVLEITGSEAEREKPGGWTKSMLVLENT